VLPSARHAPVVFPWRTLPPWVNRLLWLTAGPMWNLLLRKGLNAAREKHGLAPVRDVVTHLFDESSYVLAVDDEVLPPDAEWAQRIPSVGFLFLDTAQSALDGELDAWLRDGDPPIYVGFGSMTGRGPERMRQVIVEAIESSGRRGLVSTGWARLGDGALPKGWCVVGEVPHALLFPRMACVVHHGGAGTSATALRAGVPQVLVPLILDQYHHAQRLFEMGLAPRPVAMEKITGAQLAASIEEALRSPAAVRERTAQRLRSHDAASSVARRIAAMAGPVTA
jgi:UDP:flavonoid glycosyltransferase YjiC (YdhE family)